MNKRLRSLAGIFQTEHLIAALERDYISFLTLYSMNKMYLTLKRYVLNEWPQREKQHSGWKAT